MPNKKIVQKKFKGERENQQLPSSSLTEDIPEAISSEEMQDSPQLDESSSSPSASSPSPSSSSPSASSPSPSASSPSASSSSPSASSSSPSASSSPASSSRASPFRASRTSFTSTQSTHSSSDSSSKTSPSASETSDHSASSSSKPSSSGSRKRAVSFSSETSSSRDQKSQSTASSDDDEETSTDPPSSPVVSASASTSASVSTSPTVSDNSSSDSDVDDEESTSQESEDSRDEDLVPELIIHRKYNNYLVKFVGKPLDAAKWKSEASLKSKHPTIFATLLSNYQEINSPKFIEKLAQRRAKKAPKCKFQYQKAEPKTISDSLSLHPHQLEGFRFLMNSYFKGNNNILGDEMGLGKTIQCLTVLQHLADEYKIYGPFMVVAPVSTLAQWKAEAEKWTNLRVCMFNYSRAERELFYKHLWRYPTVKNPPLYRFDILLISYERLRMPDVIRRLTPVKWEYLILDEGHKIKNASSRTIHEVMKLNVEHKLLLTGTPLQNNLEELWALLYMLHPKRFPTFASFSKKYQQVDDPLVLADLQQLLQKHLLRRVKSDVMQELPKLEETLIDLDLTTIQKQHYKAFLEGNREYFHRIQNMPKTGFDSLLTQLRKVCNHPFLLPGFEDKEMGIKDSKEAEITYSDDQWEKLISFSSKFIFLDYLLPRLQKAGSRVLIFSSWRMNLDLLSDFLTFRGFKWVRLDGQTSQSDRAEAVSKFQDPNSDIFAFLITTKAGGLGLNLTGANTAILFDSDWNPQNDRQAIARCHRIGQTRDVKVYRLITKSVEEMIFQRASRKLALGDVILNAKQDESSFSREELAEILREGSFHFFTKENEETSFDFDKIMQNAKTLTSESLSEKPSSLFSKARFEFDDQESTKVDFNDPQFWEKVLPAFKTQEEMRAMLKNPDVFLDTPEKRDFFIKSLESLVSARLDPNREMVRRDKQDEIAALFKVSHFLEEVMALSGVLSSEQLRQVEAWLEQTRRPRLRERKPIAPVAQPQRAKKKDSKAPVSSSSSESSFVVSESDSESELSDELAFFQHSEMKKSRKIQLNKAIDASSTHMNMNSSNANVNMNNNSINVNMNNNNNHEINVKSKDVINLTDDLTEQGNLPPPTPTAKSMTREGEMAVLIERQPRGPFPWITVLRLNDQLRVQNGRLLQSSFEPNVEFQIVTDYTKILTVVNPMALVLIATTELEAFKMTNLVLEQPNQFRHIFMFVNERPQTDRLAKLKHEKVISELYYQMEDLVMALQHLKFKLFSEFASELFIDRFPPFFTGHTDFLISNDPWPSWCRFVPTSPSAQPASEPLGGQPDFADPRTAAFPALEVTSPDAPSAPRPSHQLSSSSHQLSSSSHQVSPSHQMLLSASTSRLASSETSDASTTLRGFPLAGSLVPLSSVPANQNVSGLPYRHHQSTHQDNALMQQERMQRHRIEQIKSQQIQNQQIQSQQIQNQQIQNQQIQNQQIQNQQIQNQQIQNQQIQNQQIQSQQIQNQQIQNQQIQNQQIQNQQIQNQQIQSQQRQLQQRAQLDVIEILDSEDEN